tara:strand:+ start:368 stop:610 length:243 start_codon:yes stop_codon:yes gene_type:complete
MKTATEMITFYKNLSSIGVLNEVKWQYIDMARGSNGGKLIGIEGEPSCREYNYPGQPDSFFQAVCDGMGWSYLADENESQ